MPVAFVAAVLVAVAFLAFAAWFVGVLVLPYLPASMTVSTALDRAREVIRQRIQRPALGHR